ncbi:MAG: hypothetical protein ACJ8AW_12665 [Rhodopila sp.]
MAKDDLMLASGLIKKGEARGLSPALATAQAVPEAPPAPVAVAAPAPAIVVAPEPVRAAASAAPAPQTATAAILVQTPETQDDPPLRALPPDDVPKRFTSFRLPVALDEELRAMMFETRRSKQDLLIDFVTAGIQTWRRERARRG